MYIAQYRQDDTVMYQAAFVSDLSLYQEDWSGIGARIFSTLLALQPVNFSYRLWMENTRLRRLILIQSENNEDRLRHIADELAKQANPFMAVVDSRKEFDGIVMDFPENLALVDSRPYDFAGKKIPVPTKLGRQLAALRSNEFVNQDLSLQINVFLHSLSPDRTRQLRYYFNENKILRNLPGFMQAQQDELESNLMDCVGIAEEYIGASSADALSLVQHFLISELPDSIQSGISVNQLLDSSDRGLCEDGMMTGMTQLDSDVDRIEDIVSQLCSGSDILPYLCANEPGVSVDQKAAKHHDVFISYSSRNSNQALAAVHYLESRGIRCWLAPRNVLPGKSYPEEIVKAIDASLITVLLYSSFSDQSPHVLREIERTVSLGHALLPVRLDDVTMSKNMEYMISSCHWLDATNLPSHEYLKRLTEAITSIMDYEVKHE